MSFFFGDGFDLYATPDDAKANYWDVTSINLTGFSALVTGRFSGSRGWNWSNSSRLDKVSGQNDAVHHFVLAFMTTTNTGTGLGFYVTLFDGATAQCSVVFRNDGAILLTSGGPNGTVLATYTGSAYINNVWYAFEIEVVVHNVTGSMTVRKNGNSSNDYYSGSFNTRNSANNYANKIQIGAYNIVVHNIDDFLWRSEPSTVPWVGDIRCYTRHPVSDAVAQFSRTSAPVNAVMWGGVGVYQSLAASQAEYMQFVAPYSGLLTGVTIPNAVGSGGGTGHIKAAVFSSISGTIGSVLAASSEVTNPPTGPLTMTFPTPVYVTAGQTYWVGVINDSGSITCNVRNNPVEALALIVLSTTPYASWPVSNPGGSPGSLNAPGITLVFTPQSNSDAVGELTQDLAANYVYSSTNGQNDLYNLGSIGATPAQVLGVVTRGFFEKSDVGTRNATVQLKSGGITVQGADTALTTLTWNWIYRNDLVDPATSVAWTPTAVNSVQIGPRVTA